MLEGFLVVRDGEVYEGVLWVFLLFLWGGFWEGRNGKYNFVFFFSF